MRRMITLHTLQKRTCKPLCNLHLHMSKGALHFAPAPLHANLHLHMGKEHVPPTYNHAPH